MIHWDDSLHTGHATIDADHCQLIATLNELERDLRARNTAGSLGATIRSLQVYAREHFAREEALMLATDCPAYVKNHLEHERFTGNLQNWLERVERDGPSPELAFDVYHGIGNWLAAHIRGTDCALRGCTHRRRFATSATSSEAPPQTV